jgi:hypothetical protein
LGDAVGWLIAAAFKKWRSFAASRGTCRRHLPLALLLLCSPALAQEPPDPGIPDPMQAATYAEAYALTQEVTGLGADAQRYEGARWIGQAGFGPWGIAIRADVMGLPGVYNGGQVETFRAAEAVVVAHRNLVHVEGVTCGPAAALGYAVALADGNPSFARAMTAGIGAQCSSGGRTVIALAGQYQAVPGVAGMVGVIWPLSSHISWMGDFGVGARGQRVARIAVAVSLKTWGRR